MLKYLARLPPNTILDVYFSDFAIQMLEKGH